MLAALYGGWRAGLLATVLSAITGGLFLDGAGGPFAIGQPADWLGLVIFLLSGAMIAWVTEAMHRARARASAAETQALLAAQREAAAEALRESRGEVDSGFASMTDRRVHLRSPRGGLSTSTMPLPRFIGSRARTVRQNVRRVSRHPGHVHGRRQTAPGAVSSCQSIAGRNATQFRIRLATPGPGDVVGSYNSRLIRGPEDGKH